MHLAERLSANSKFSLMVMVLVVENYLLHPKTIVEGCLYLKGNGLLWSERNGLLWSECVFGYYGACMLGYYGRMVYGSYDHVPILGAM